MFLFDINPIKAPSINIIYFPNSGLIIHELAFTGTRIGIFINRFKYLNHFFGVLKKFD